MKDLFVVNCLSKWSNRNSEYYWELELIDPDTGKLYHTYVSDSYDNWKRWAPVVGIMERCKDTAVVLTGTFKRKRKNPGLVSADSQVEVTERFNRTEFMNWVANEYY